MLSSASRRHAPLDHRYPSWARAFEDAGLGGEPYPKEPYLLAADVLRWLSGMPPALYGPEDPLPAMHRSGMWQPPAVAAWETNQPRRGLGLPKPLPGRQSARHVVSSGFDGQPEVLADFGGLRGMNTAPAGAVQPA